MAETISTAVEVGVVLVASLPDPVEIQLNSFSISFKYVSLLVADIE